MACLRTKFYSCSLMFLLTSIALCDLSAESQSCDVANTGAGKFAHCEGRRFTSPPRGLPSDISTLDLSNNLIRSLHGPASPSVSSITDSHINFSMHNYKDLQRLFLANNRINYISPLAFHGLNSLEVLDLSGNNLTSLPRVFSNLTSLKTVYLNDSPHLVQADFTVFSTLQNLEYLSLTGSKIKTIDIKFHIGLRDTQLRFLNLTNNAIYAIQAYAFNRIDTLENIVLDQNALSENEVALSLYGLRDNKRIKSLSLRYLDDKLTYLTPSTFCNLQNTQIRNLSVAYNFIKTLGAGVFTCVSSLEHLDLSFSYYLESVSDRAFHGLRRLKSLNLRGARLVDIPLALASLRALEYLDMSNNLISALPSLSPLHYVRKLKTLYLNENDLKYLTKDSFSELHNLEFLDCGYNSLNSIEDGSFQDLHNLQTLILSGVYVESVTKEKLQGLENLTMLDLQSSSIRSLPDDMFVDCPNIRRINLARSQLKSVNGTFQNLKHLEVLQLQSNGIEGISENAFEGSQNLTAINLGGNSLKYFPRAIASSEIQSLRNLNISHNHITFIGMTATKILRSTLNTFDGSWNPFECDCKLAPFALWLNATSANPEVKILPSMAAYICSSPSEEKDHQINTKDYSDCPLNLPTDGLQGAPSLSVPVWAIVVIQLVLCVFVSTFVIYVIRRRRRLKQSNSHRLEEGESKEHIPMGTLVKSKFQAAGARLGNSKTICQISSTSQRCCREAKRKIDSIHFWGFKRKSNSTDNDSNEKKGAVFTTDSSGDMLLPIQPKVGSISHKSSRKIFEQYSNASVVDTPCGSNNDAFESYEATIYDDVIPINVTDVNLKRI